MDINQAQKQFILQQPLIKVMWKMSLPGIIAMVLYGLNNFMDAIYVRQLLNENAFAGIAIAYSLKGRIIKIIPFNGNCLPLKI